MGGVLQRTALVTGASGGIGLEVDGTGVAPTALLPPTTRSLFEKRELPPRRIALEVNRILFDKA